MKKNSKNIADEENKSLGQILNEYIVVPIKERFAKQKQAFDSLKRAHDTLEKQTQELYEKVDSLSKKLLTAEQKIKELSSTLTTEQKYRIGLEEAISSLNWEE